MKLGDSPRLKALLACVLEDHGLRVQWSVFECGSTGPEMQALRRRLLELAEPGADRLRFYPLCGPCWLSDDLMFVVISYDIADNRRRAREASEIKNFGQRVQYNVFECHLSEAEISDLETRLQAIIDWDRDRVRYYRLCERDARRIVMDGPGEVSRDWNYLIL